jgi:DNA-directed RNA polymerase subunit RPC12/RpoP
VNGLENDLRLETLRGERCPRCGPKVMGGCEYAYGSPERYDGISEWVCPSCGTRVGRWTGRVLTGSMAEPRFGRGVLKKVEL